MTEQVFGREGGGVGFNNPSMPWSELERRLSGAAAPTAGSDGPGDRPEWANGGDGPAWSRRREAYEPPARLAAPASAVPYAELHCHTNFSFLQGTSHPEELVEEAVRLRLRRATARWLASRTPTTKRNSTSSSVASCPISM